MRRPNTKQLERVISWLDSLGLSVYGQAVDLQDGELLPGCKDYDLEDILKLYELTKTDSLYYRDES